MALKNGKPNPLNFFKMRRVTFAAPHFKYMSVDRYSPMLVKQLDGWIQTNLNNRYYIGQEITLDHNNSITYITKVGFESEKDLSFFTIACPYLHGR